MRGPMRCAHTSAFVAALGLAAGCPNVEAPDAATDLRDAWSLDGSSLVDATHLDPTDPDAPTSLVDASETDAPIDPALDSGSIDAASGDAVDAEAGDARDPHDAPLAADAPCPPRLGDCDGLASNGCETPLTTSADCGGCGVPCAPSGAVGDCSTGTCQVVACLRADFGDCDGLASNGCETSLRTTGDCAACGVPCTVPGGAATCASGFCSPTGCAVGLANCDAAPGCEQSTNTSTHCGDCNVACAPSHAAASCATGTCQITRCDDGWLDCDGRASNGCERESAGC